MTNFCSINTRYSAKHFLVPLLVFLSITILVNYSNCAIIYKLSLYGVLTYALIYAIYHIQSHSNNCKLDFLFDIQNIVITKNNKTELYEIDKWFSLGSWCVIISIQNKHSKKNIIIAKYSCEIEAYKHLLRNVIWNRLKTS
jgi:hypothetical protein